MTWLGTSKAPHEASARRRRGLFRLGLEALSRRDMPAGLVAWGEVENNDTAPASQPLRGTTNFLVRGSVSSVNDVDSFTFTAAKGVHVALNARATVLTGRDATEFAPRMTVYAPDASLIAASASGGVGSRQAAGFSFFAAAGGIYRVVVSGRQQDPGVGMQTGGYALRVTKIPPALAASGTVAPVEANVLSRLAIYQPATSTPQVSDWKPVVAGDSRLSGKNVYVAVHGWATDYAGVPQLNGTSANPLKWWQTIDYSHLTPAKNPITGKNIPLTEPVASYMFLPQAGEDADHTQMTPGGLAWQLLQSDPNAVVLAYSWIDDSATTLPAPSEAHTTLNGARLARALEQALPTAGGTTVLGLHLIGHSHGSKVATVAATLLRQDGRTVNHLTILDSPEQGASVTGFNATNNLWYFLAALNVDRGQAAGTTFVDNYISQLDRSLGLIQGYDPYAIPAVPVTTVQQVVDVTLNPRPLLPAQPKATDPFAHRYAPAWYSGGSAAWSGNPAPTTANQWSPLVTNPSVSKPIAFSSTQSWQTPTDPQFALTSGANPNTAKYDPRPSQLTLLPVARYAPRPTFNGTVTLAGNGQGRTVSQAFTFKTPALTATDSFGISFNLQFTQYELDDQLQITVNTAGPFVQKEVFVMTAKQLADNEGIATLSLGSLYRNPGLLRTKRIEFNLIPSAGSQCRTTVNISNIKQFIVPGV